MGRNWAGGESVLLCWNILTSAFVTPRTLKSSPHQLVAQIVKVTNSKVSATECREKCSNGVAKRKEQKKNDEEMIQSLKWKQNTPQQLSWAQSKPVGWSFFSHHHCSDCLLLCSYPAGHHLEYIQYIQHESFYGIIGSVLSVLHCTSTPCDWGVWYCLIRVLVLFSKKNCWAKGRKGECTIFY